MKKYLFYLVWSGIFLWGQKNGQFPYSIFGWGENIPFRYHHQNLSGELSAAIVPDTVFPSLLNASQPASLPDIRFATFEVGAKHRMNQLTRGGNRSALYYLTNFDYASLAFPMGSKGGLCFGISPFTTTGYSLQTVYADPQMGNVIFNQNGDGGFNNAFAGFGIQPFKFSLLRYLRKLSSGDPIHLKKKYLLYKLISEIRFGIQAGWLFGQQIQTTQIIYPAGTKYLNHFRERIIRPLGVMPSVGIIWQWIQDSTKGKSLREKNIFSFGIIFRPSVGVRLSEEKYSYNYFSLPITNNIKDSSEKSITRNIRFRLPSLFTFGVGFRKGYSLTTGMEMSYTDFRTNSFSFSAVPMQNITSVGWGISWVPEKFAFGKGSYFKRVRYSAGATYVQGYASINGRNVRMVKTGAGLSLPIGIRTGTGMLHLGFQYYQNHSDPILFFNEKGIMFLLGITFNSTYLEDFWFRKFRYD